MSLSPAAVRPGLVGPAATALLADDRRSLRALLARACALRASHDVAHARSGSRHAPRHRHARRPQGRLTRPSAAQTCRLVDGDALDEGREHVGLADRSLGRVEQVPVQDGDVGEGDPPPALRPRRGGWRRGAGGRGGQDVDQLQRLALVGNGRGSRAPRPRRGSRRPPSGGTGPESKRSYFEPMTSVAPFAPASGTGTGEL